ncbi:hypothetical protein [Aeromicrobium sp. CTD01-1L150]|uniref:hypothetical protein n=1 Tax=Aeromicrobium sp. CTD01-1L150 TaxID=3341830 RepID=UPI0035C14598
MKTFRIHLTDMSKHDVLADRVVRDDTVVYLDSRVENQWQEVARYDVNEVAEVRRRATDVDGRWFWLRCRLTLHRNRFDVRQAEDA